MWRLMLLLVLLAACGPQADANAVVQVFLSAREVGDVDGALSVVAPDAVMRAPNELQYRGIDQIRQRLQATLSDYSLELTQAPRLDTGHVSWRDNLYSLANARWVGELAWEADVTDFKITNIRGQVIRGASGIICPLCPEGTRI